MILFKVDTKTMTVRQVEGDPWPGRDSEGDEVFANTHFKTMPEALEKLKACAQGFIALSAYRVKAARHELAQAEKDAADAIIAADTAFKFIEENRNDSSEG